MKVVALSGSPSPMSRTAALADYVCTQVGRAGIDLAHVRIADLPPAALLAGDAKDQAIAAAIRQLEAAEGLVIATPIYKAAYSGLLKSFIDLLPQFAFKDKVVLPLATGGTLAHVLALDYGLRPVLQSLWPRHVVRCYFVLDRLIEPGQEAVIRDETVRLELDGVIDAFVGALSPRAVTRDALLSESHGVA